MKLLDLWFQMPEKLRFLFIGGFNAGVSYTIYAIYCLIFGDSSYQIALSVSWILSSIISFSSQKFFVFRSKGNWVKEYLKCCGTWFFGYFINAGLLEALVKFAHQNIYVAQIIATGLTAIFTYIMFKKFAFKKRDNS